MTTNRLYGVPEIAQMLDCHHETVADLFIRKRLPGVKVGRSWRVTETALYAALDCMCMENMLPAGARATTPERSKSSRRRPIPELLDLPPEAS